MPSNLINKVVDSCDMTKEKAEKLWEKAKELAEKEDHKDDYDYITGIWKKILGKDCLKKLDWKITESELIKKIDLYLRG